MPKPTLPPDAAPSSPAALQQQQLAAHGDGVQTRPRPPRRSFSAAEKLRLLRLADACLANGPRGALEAMYRKEGLYSSLVSAWRAQLATHGPDGLKAGQVGRPPVLDAAERRCAELAARNADLERQLHVAQVLLSLQKNYLGPRPTCWTRNSGPLQGATGLEGATDRFLETLNP